METHELAPPRAISPAASFIDALRARLAADRGAQVQLIETHISWVLLTPDRAYKVKKPVRLPFVDFGTHELRRRACDEELRLNRRLAPTLYLDVVPVCGTSREPRLGDSGPVIDHAVCMRRFAPGALLGERLRERRLTEHDIDRLALRIADFHRHAAAALPGSEYAAPAHAVQPVRDVLDRLAPFVAAPVHAALRRWLEGQADALRREFEARGRDGAVRECHGDLHLDNAVADGDDVTAFDCLEFDPALRWTDVMADVGFLTMDLEAHGRADLAHRFLDAYLQRSGDYDGLRVLRYYEVYRALVRSLVAALRGGRDATDYLACARRLIDHPVLAPRLLITHGLAGSGKTTLSGRLLEASGAVRVRSDVERKRLAGLGALERSAPRRLDLYTEDMTRRTFARLAACAALALRSGYAVIVDAAFLRRAERHSFRALAEELCVPYAILDCRADVALLRSRVAARRDDASEADVAVLERQAATREPLDDEERALALPVDACDPPPASDLLAHWRVCTFAARR